MVGAFDGETCHDGRKTTPDLNRRMRYSSQSLEEKGGINTASHVRGSSSCVMGSRGEGYPAESSAQKTGPGWMDDGKHRSIGMCFFYAGILCRPKRCQARRAKRLDGPKPRSTAGSWLLGGWGVLLVQSASEQGRASTVTHVYPYPFLR